MTDVLTNINQGFQTGYFSLNQCIYSPIAQSNGIDNIPWSDYHLYKNPKLIKPQIINNLHKLFKHCINPLFRKYGQRLGLTSVYRNREVNKLLGGVPNSQHIYGYAADIVLIDGTTSLDLFNWCRVHIPQYHQLIWEYPEKGEYNRDSTNDFSWVHISYIEESNFKKNSVSSRDPQIHENYKTPETYHIGNFTHNIPFIDKLEFTLNTQY